MRFEVAESEVEVVVNGTFGVVGSELCVAGERTDTLLVSDTPEVRIEIYLP